MYTVKLKSGRNISAYNVINDAFHNALFIRTNELTPIEAYTIFGNADDIDLIIVTNDKDPDHEERYKWYTKVHGVYEDSTPNYKNAIEIWLKQQYPE